MFSLEFPVQSAHLSLSWLKFTRVAQLVFLLLDLSNSGLIVPDLHSANFLPENQDWWDSFVIFLSSTSLNERRECASGKLENMNDSASWWTEKQDNITNSSPDWCHQWPLYHTHTQTEQWTRNCVKLQEFNEKINSATSLTRVFEFTSTNCWGYSFHLNVRKLLLLIKRMSALVCID